MLKLGKYWPWKTVSSHLNVDAFAPTTQAIPQLLFPTSENLGRKGYKLWAPWFWGSFCWTSVMIGRWYSRQQLSNHKNACPPTRSHKSLYPKLLPIPHGGILTTSLPRRHSWFWVFAGYFTTCPCDSFAPCQISLYPTHVYYFTFA